MAQIEDIIQHVTAINRCNQRGGRMLSLVDLIRAKSMPLDLAAFLLYRVNKGDSFIIGALPGGAGKTTVMGALINCIPVGMPIEHAKSMKTILDGEEARKSCFVCHEIGEAGHFAYLWGEELRAFFSLKKYGHTLASNLHADSLELAKRQIVKQNRVGEKEFNSINFYIFISPSITKEISEVWYSRGDGSEHLQIYGGGTLKINNYMDNDAQKIYTKFLDDCVDDGVETIEDFRTELIDFLEE